MKYCLKLVNSCADVEMSLAVCCVEWRRLVGLIVHMASAGPNVPVYRGVLFVHQVGYATFID